MSTHSELAARFAAALELPVNPVAITFRDEVPPGIARFSGAAPAGCSFWEHGTTRTFATDTGDHLLCAIGVHTHNLSGAPALQARELQDAVGAMIGLDYVREAEVQAIPTMQEPHRHVIYGPLGEHPFPPDVVLMFSNARRGLVLAEAVQRVDGGMPVAMGRPACAIIPQVITQDAAAMSLGCCGARAYLEGLSDDVALWGLPGGKLHLYASEVEVLARANKVLATFHAIRRKEIADGKRPTIRDSLAQLDAEPASQ